MGYSFPYTSTSSRQFLRSVYLSQQATGRFEFICSTFALYFKSIFIYSTTLLLSKMQYTQLAVLALAFGAEARNQRRQAWGSGNHPWVSAWGQNTDAPASAPSKWGQASGAPASEVTAESGSGATNSSGSDASSSSASSAPLTTASATLTSSDVASGGSIPASSGTSVLDAVQTIAAGESYDGGMFVIDRGVDCTGQEEGAGSDAVFILEVSLV